MNHSSGGGAKKVTMGVEPPLLKFYWLFLLLFKSLVALFGSSVTLIMCT